MVPTKQCAASVAAFVLIVAGAAFGSAARAADPDIPAPPNSRVAREVQAGGAQVYGCRQTPDGTYAWTLIGPDAVLIDADGTTFGTHAAGPTWTAADGSAITADGTHPVVVVKRPGSVPALLLNVNSSTGTGALTGVRFVRRWDTEGGVAPATGCDAAHANARVAVHYSAVYTFYR
jgi:hypothetical protein